MKRHLLTFITCFAFLWVGAQNLRINVTDSDTNSPIAEAVINYNLFDYVTNEDGFVEVPIDYSKSAVFVVSKIGFKTNTIAVNDLEGMKSYIIQLDASRASNNIIVLDDDELLEDENNGAVSSILRASRDNFLSAAAYNFGVGRFRVRGYGNEYSRTLINGLPMQTLHNSRVPFNFWGGLNDVLRNNTPNLGMDASEFTFGDLNGASNTDISARVQRKQRRISYASSNRSYRNRLMYTHSTGLMKNGWAFTFSGSRRWAQEGYSEGTPYDAWSYFFSADKKINENNYISLSFMGAPVERGSSSGSLNEMYEIADDNFYNSNWGYLDGKKVSARNWKIHQPMLSLKHDSKINDKLDFTHSLGLVTGRTGRTRLDWYNAPDPRPDYYRYLPSYYNGSVEAEASIYAALANDKSKRQLNWDRMFEVNRNNFTTLDNVNGTGDEVSGLRSLYGLQENREDINRFMYSAIANYNTSGQSTLSGGLTAQIESTHFFQTMDNLLGGDYWYDVNQFVEREFPGDEDKIQADLNNPNRVIREGDTYGYNYRSNTTDATLWTSYNAVLPKVDFHIGASINYNSFYRVGEFKNGAFPDNSEGKSEVLTFISPSVKGGINYKINGRNYIYANASYTKRAPDFRNSFISPRFRNDVLEDAKQETAYSGEIAYVMRSPKLKAKALGYFTQFRDLAEIRSFFIDGQSSAFVNFITTGTGTTHVGTELAAEYKITSTLTAKIAAGIGQNYIDVRPTATAIQDNTGEVIIDEETIYVKNFRLPGAQSAYTLGLSYNSPKYWFISLNANYFDHSYLSHSPLRRTVDAVDGLDRESELYTEVLQQTRLDPGFTLDLFGGKSWRVNGQYINLNVGVNNLLNSKNIISGGFEQARYAVVEGTNTIETLDRFPNRYFYAWGLNYFVSLAYSF